MRPTIPNSTSSSSESRPVFFGSALNTRVTSLTRFFSLLLMSFSFSGAIQVHGHLNLHLSLLVLALDVDRRHPCQPRQLLGVFQERKDVNEITLERELNWGLDQLLAPL